MQNKIIAILVIVLLVGAGICFYFSNLNCPVIPNTCDNFNGSRHLYAGKMVLDCNNPTINTAIKNQPSYYWNKFVQKWCVV